MLRCVEVRMDSTTISSLANIPSSVASTMLSDSGSLFDFDLFDKSSKCGSISSSWLSLDFSKFVLVIAFCVFKCEVMATMRYSNYTTSLYLYVPSSLLNTHLMNH